MRENKEIAFSNFKIIPPTLEELRKAKETSRVKNSNIKKCKICGTKFDFGYSNKVVCGCCKIKYLCTECGKEVVFVLNSHTNSRGVANVIKDIENKSSTDRFCCNLCAKRNTIAKWNKSPEGKAFNRALGIKNITKFNNSGSHKRKIMEIVYNNPEYRRNSAKRMKNLHTKKFCDICNKITHHSGRLCISCHNKKLNKIKFCSICDKETHHVKNTCSVCNMKKVRKESQNTKFCTICNKKTMHIGKSCSSCIGSRQIKKLLNNKYCVKCDRITQHSGKMCKVCNGKISANILNNFEREEFYKSQLDIVKLNTVEETVSLNDIEKYLNIPGVWARYTPEGDCLNVCETKDIGKELLKSIRKFNNIKDKAKFDEYKSNNSNLYKSWWDTYIKELKDSSGCIVIKIIATNIKTKEERERIEMQYAHNKKAKYWNPAPNQIKKPYI